MENRGFRLAEWLSGISNLIIPLLVFFVVAYGLANKVKIYEHFINGARDGFETVVQILPTLVGLMIATGVLQASGFLQMLSELLAPVGELVNIPASVIPFIFVKMFSSSAATGLVLNLFKEYGTDSFIGTLVSIMASTTETVFYTMSVYYMAAKVTKVRYTLSGALLSTIVGVVISMMLTQMLI